WVKRTAPTRAAGSAARAPLVLGRLYPLPGLLSCSASDCRQSGDQPNGPTRSGKEWQLRGKMRSRGRKAERLSSVSEIVPGCRQLASWSFKTGSYYAGTAARSKAAAIRARV